MSNRPTFGAVAAALLILAAFSPSLEAQCPSPPPVLNQVSPNGITTPGDVTVTWSAPTTAAVAVAYEVFVGFNDAAPTSRGMVATTSYTIQNVPPSTGVAMYVIAKTAVCPAGTQSGTLRFSACSAIKPLLSDPAEAASFTASPGGAAAVSFNWSGVPGATSYDVMVSSDGGASFLPSVTTSTTSGTANLLPGNYVTYIRAFLGPWCPPAESARRTFRVLPASCPTEKATPTAPAGGSTVAAGSPLTFTWTAVPSAVGYDLMISSDDGKTFVPRATVSATTAAPAASVTLGPGTYLWFVRTNFANCPPTASQVFRVIVVAATGCPASTPALLAPAGDSTVNNPVTFSWTAATGANRYRLMVSHDGGAFNAIALTDQTRYTATIPAGTIDWYVEALFDGCPSTQSQRSRFTVAPVAGCPSSPGKAAIVSPPNGATGLASPVTFRWNPVPGATEYRVLASFNGAALVSLGTTTGTSLTAPVAQATVFWFVETFFGKGCPSTLSERSLFTVAAGAACGTTAPTLVSPANGATDVRSPVTLQWNSVAGAVNYEVFVSLDGTSFDLLGQTSSTSLTRILPAGSVSWYVEAQFPGCPDLRSATSRFTISDAKSCPAGPITPNAPAAGSTVASPVTFSWSAIAGTPVYRVWLAHEGGAPALIARTTTTTATIPLPSGSAEWFVEAVTADCPSVYSPKVRFTIERGATCSGQAPSLLAPAAGASVTSPVELEWSAVPGAIAYRVWIASGAQPFSDLGIVTATKIKRELPAGAHQWYVEALFTGCPPVPSARGSFTVSTASRCGEAPALVSPADGATNVTNPVTLLWSNVTNAEGYRIFGSLDGTRFTLIGETRETTLTRAMPPGTITWYVEAVVRGCPSARSPNSRFTIARASDCNGEAPQLVSPANGATNIASPVDFVWNPVSGAVGYVVVVRLGDGSPIPVGQTAETHLLKTLPEGTFEWWVIAQFASCPGTESAHFTFSIPQTACDNRRPLLLTPPDGARDIAPAVFFSWTPVPRAKSYRLWASIDDDPPTLLATPSGSAEATVTLPSGSVRWMVEAVFDNCPATQSAIGKFTVGSSAACRTPDKPTASVAGQVLTNTTYGVRWTPLPGVTQYELQEATTADFSGATTQVVSGVAAAFTHSVSGTPMQYRYRVRGISTCSDERGPYSDVVAVTVMPLATATAPRQHASVEIGSQSGLTQRVFLPGSTSPVAFSVTADKPWMTVTPSSGTIPPEGLTLTVTFDPAALRPGTNSGSLSITYGASGKGATDATTVSKVPLSISLVTPVAPGGNNTPLPESLIIPAIAHAPGANDSLFESDVRVTNLGAETMKYQLHFTPSGTDGTQNGSSTTIEVAPGATMALDDILSSFFGSTTASGTLEIRPLTTTSTTGGLTTSATSAAPVTVASSRTYNQTATGTFGQYIPAIPFSQFIGKSSSEGARTVLSLQQIAQSQAFRTNLGLVEGSGEPASVLLSVFDGAGKKVGEIPVSLLPGEHRQINSILEANGITLTDGRIEVEVTSDTGKVTAYASTVDNRTNDPLLVSPVPRAAQTSTKFVLPGMADLPEPNDFRSDIRLFNAGSSSITVTPAYYAQGSTAPRSGQPLTIAPGEVKAIDDVLPTLFGVTSSGGSIVLTTSEPAALVATGRTFSTDANGGTYGQFIPGVTPDESAVLGGRALQILQLEHSSRFRTNIGLAETSGNAATVEVSVTLPDSKVTPKVTIPLAANEFRQISLGDFGLTDVYNARVTVKVVAGSGRVAAYGSVIDQVTADPTYVPAQ